MDFSRPIYLYSATWLCFFSLILSCGTTQKGKIDADPLAGLSDFKSFPLEGGYPPGTIIAERTDGTISSPLVTKTRLLKSVSDSSILDFSDPKPYPVQYFERRTTFLSNLKLNLNFSKASSNVQNKIREVNSVTLELESGSSYYLKSGEIAWLDLVEELPESDIKKIKNVISKDVRAVMITEVLEYKNASVIFKWKNKVDKQAQNEIVSIIGVDGNIDWTNESELRIKYLQSLIVGYKSILIADNKSGSLWKKIGWGTLFASAGLYYLFNDEIRGNVSEYNSGAYLTAGTVPGAESERAKIEGEVTKWENLRLATIPLGLASLVLIIWK